MHDEDGIDACAFCDADGMTDEACVHCGFGYPHTESVEPCLQCNRPICDGDEEGGLCPECGRVEA
jgi:hypothetical protein